MDKAGDNLLNSLAEERKNLINLVNISKAPDSFDGNIFLNIFNNLASIFFSA